MATKRLNGDALPYDGLENHELDTNTNRTASATASSNLGGPSQPHDSASRNIVRRRQAQPIPRPFNAMSVVSLKRLFFNQVFIQVPIRPYDRPEYDALLRPARVPNNEDVESQDSKIEKASQKKGFRIDARVIGDATLGLSDGLTVPFALTAGLSALGNTKVVIYGGLAELIAGAISMGLGGWLGAKSEVASYKAQKSETEKLIAADPRAVMAGITEVFEPYNLPQQTLDDLTRHLGQSPRLVDFVMQFQHCTEEPASSRAAISAITIALGYFLGGLLPLLPYMFVGTDQVYQGLKISICVMAVALFLFGYVKECIVAGWSGDANIKRGCKGGVLMVVVGSAAAAAAMGLVKVFNTD